MMKTESMQILFILETISTHKVFVKIKTREQTALSAAVVYKLYSNISRFGLIIAIVRNVLSEAIRLSMI